jgi:hypothetical protein
MAVVITALLWATFGSQTSTHAQLITPRADWKGDSIVYDGHQYFPVNDEKSIASLGMPEGTQSFVYIPEVAPNTKTAKALVLYFSPGVDPPTATTISFASYTYTVATKQYSNPTDKKDVDITVKGAETSLSSCSVSGIGWFICPIMVFLSEGMDKVFGFVAGFMAVQPPNVGNTNNTLYVAWSVMRSIANVAFIIVFLVIIYSQVTSTGVSNYGLKKLLPRLVVAAVLVNVSYIISAIAVDLSNIIGYSLQDIFVAIRQNTFNITNDTWNATTTTWTAITAAVLSGGAIAVAGVTLAGDLGGVIYVILPLLVGLILTVLFVLLILAARQAIIVLLIIVSPLAFVAYLLPNTEQWFKRWRELFMTMLVFFPAFSLVFGGSQLAGGLIIQNATSVFMIVFGLAVQVAPLVITPLILRFSGGVLGKIAGMVNDPRKGLLDRTKVWSKDRQGMRRMESLKTPNTRNPFRKAAQFFNDNNEDVKNRTAQYTADNDNRYRSRPRYEKIYQGTQHAEHTKHGIDARLERDLNAKIVATPHLFDEHLEVASMVDESASTKKALETALKVAKTGTGPTYGPQTAHRTQLLENAKRITKQLAAQEAGGQSADAEIQKMIAQSFNIKLKDDNSNMTEFLATKALLHTAGGIQGSIGITRARANATAALAKIESEATDNNLKLLGAEAMLAGTSLKIHTGRIVDEVLKGRGAQYEKSVIEAALEAQAQEGQIKIVEDARGSTYFDQADVAKVIARNIGTMKQKGGFHLQADPDLNIEYFLAKEAENNPTETNPAAVMKNARKAFDRAMNLNRIASLGDTSADSIKELKAGWLENMQALFMGEGGDELLDMAMRDTKYRASLEAAQANFDLALNNEQVRATIGDRIPQVQDIRNKLNEKLGPIKKNPDAPQNDDQTPTA